MIKNVVTGATSPRLWAGCAVSSLLLLAACQTESAIQPDREGIATMANLGQTRLYSGKSAGRPDKEVPADSVRLFDDPPVKPGGPGCCH